MKKNTLNKYIVVLCLLALFSCKAKKQLVAVRKPDTTTTTAPIATAIVPKVVVDNFKVNKLIAIRAKQVDFNTFSGKAQAKLSIDGSDHDVTMTIRIKKNQEIWVSITAVLGIEVARALITPDSIKVLNRLDATYLKKPFNYVYSYTSRQINYKTLESLLIGNAIPELISDSASLKPDNGNVIVSGNLHELAYQLILNPGLKVNQTHMSSQTAGQSLQVDNAAFIQATNRAIPSQININSSSKQKKIQVELHYTKADFDQSLSFPFSVPARFALIN
jgi:hypothetical protein